MIEYLFNITQQKWHQTLYIIVSYITVFLYLIAFVGLSINAPKYLSILHEILKIYISIILILRFNPYNKYNFNKENYDFDRKIAFSSGVFLLFTTGFTNYIKNILS